MGFARHCEGARVQALPDLIHYAPGTAGFLQFTHAVRAVGPDRANEHRALGSFLEEADDVHLELRFGCYGGEVPHGVHRAPDSEIHLDGVRKGLLGQHVPQAPPVGYPHVTRTVGTLRRAAAMRWPGVVLSQEERHTIPSSCAPSTMTSMSLTIRSRVGIR